jgi:transposase
MKPKKLSRKDAQGWRNRRRQAERLFVAGERQSEIARRLGVSRQCVHNWYWEWQGEDPSLPTFRRTGSGRKAKLTLQQLAAVDTALRRGPQAFGFGNERWTLSRIATTIERITGVHYHSSSVWRILRALGWTLRLPPLGDGHAKGYIPRQWAAPERRFLESP